MPDNHSKEVRSYNMSRIRSKGSKPENLVCRYLFSRGLRYRKNDKRYPGHPDIILPKYKTAIFVNGCFWHMHTGCKLSCIPHSNVEYWIPKLQHNFERDEINTNLLEQSGWKVITVWECKLCKKFLEQRLIRLYEEITRELGE